MRKYLWCGLLFLIVAPLRAEAPAKSVKETWNAVYIEAFRCGYARTTVVELERDGKKYYRTTLEMNMVIKRYDSVVRIRAETTVDETADGKVTGFTLTQFTDKGDKLTMTGTVQDDKLLVKAPGDPRGRSVPWNDKAIGPYKQERLLVERKIKAGDKLEFLGFEPALAAAVPTHIVVKAAEDVELMVAKKDGETIKFERSKQNLLRIELQPEKVKTGDASIPLPTQSLWVDKDTAIIRSEYDFGLGRFLLFRTTKEAATLEVPSDPDKMPDVGLNTKIPIAKAVDNIHSKAQVVYRITIKDDKDAATAFARDARQEVKNKKDDTFDLQVQAVRAPAVVEKPVEPGKEFLESSHYIESADATVKELTARAVGDETDPWKKAQRIEKWVHENMRGSSDIGFATAGQVARDLRGDCRQHAMLTTAMCRAAGVPARTAVGLVYVRQEEMEPFLGFHMWTEVWIKGQWLGLDATLGKGSVGPGHLKIADHSWHDTQTLAPVLPVLRVMGKVKVEVVSVK